MSITGSILLIVLGSLGRVTLFDAGQQVRPEFATIIAAAVGGALALISGWLVAIATTRRERAAFRRELQRGQVERLRAVFEDALVILERHERNIGQSSTSDVAEMLRLKARLLLGANAPIANQFEATAIALDKWAIEARQGQPKLGNGTLLSAGTGQEKHHEAAVKLRPFFDSERAKLITAMRDELRHAENAII